MRKSLSTPNGVAASGARTKLLPLFAWADARQDNHQPVNLPSAARIVARRFGLPIPRARVIAELAGFPLEAA
jgi:hypothetical protein